jgi:hypothetical protein
MYLLWRIDAPSSKSPYIVFKTDNRFDAERYLVLLEQLAPDSRYQLSVNIYAT